MCFLGENYPLEQQWKCSYFCLFPEPSPYFSPHSVMILNPHPLFVLIPRLSHTGYDVFTVLQSEMPHVPGGFLFPAGSPLVFLKHTSPFPRSMCDGALAPVMWLRGTWQSRWPWESARSHTPLIFPVTCGISFLLPLLTREGSYFKQTLPASGAFLIPKTQADLRIKRNE